MSSINDSNIPTFGLGGFFNRLLTFGLGKIFKSQSFKKKETKYFIDFSINIYSSIEKKFEYENEFLIPLIKRFILENRIKVNLIKNILDSYIIRNNIIKTINEEYDFSIKLNNQKLINILELLEDD